MQGNNLTIPIAIVIAGALIAGALFITNQSSTGSTDTDIEDASEVEIAIRPLSPDDHILGNPEAPLVFVEYSDTECPFCQRFHTTMHRIIDLYGRDGDVAWVYRHFPIAQLHSRAPEEARATECAAEVGGESGFWSYIDRLYEVTPANNGLDPARLPEIAVDVGLNRTSFESCLASNRHRDRVEQDFEDARFAGGRGTPYTVLVLTKPASAGVADFLESTSVELPPNTLALSKDRKRIAIAGALPFEFIDQLIKTITAL